MSLTGLPCQQACLCIKVEFWNSRRIYPDESPNPILSGRYKAAARLAEAVHEGPALAKALRRVAAALAAAAVRMQLAEEAASVGAAQAPGGRGGSLWTGSELAGTSGDREAWPPPEGAEGAVEGSGAAWALLRALLARHCGGGCRAGAGSGSGLAGQLPLAAAEAVLAADRRVRLPAWMRALFQVSTAPQQEH